jgi:uncharacterized membrane protein
MSHGRLLGGLGLAAATAWILTRPRAAKPVRKAVTINRPREDVERAWAEAERLRAKLDGASVRFDAAPADRGTELVVELRDDAPLAQKLLGRDLATQLADDLRRFKQRVETGEVIRSDATPSGHRLAEHLKQRPARPR